MTYTNLQVGDVIEISAGDKFDAQVPEHFVYTNRRGSFKLCKAEITLGQDKDFDYFIGTYVVVKTTYDGGGVGHGASDTYPDGHHVHCENVDNRRLKLDFYQDGCFTAMMPNKKAIGKATIKWQWSRNEGA